MTKFFGILAAGGLVWFMSGNFWAGLIVAIIIINAMGGEMFINRFTDKLH
jgi:hypothetical protein